MCASDTFKNSRQNQAAAILSEANEPLTRRSRATPTRSLKIKEKRVRFVQFYAILRLICIRDTIAARAAIKEAPIAP